MSWSPAAVFDDNTASHPLEGSASFEHGIDLVGYVASSTPMRRGETLELITVWRPGREVPAAASELKVFVHLMDAQSRVWGAEDRLDLHPPTWEQNDLLVQLHRVPLSAEASPGVYQLEIGLYAPITMKRLALYGGPGEAQSVGDRLLLSPISVLE
jgi:hypothetical protein